MNSGNSVNLLTFILLLLFPCVSHAALMLAAPQVCHQDNCVSVEVVSKPADLERGLMYRDSLAQDKGMFFVFNTDSRESFWMKNMRFGLDLVWIDSGDHVVYVAPHVPACTQDPCAVYTPEQNARYVLEINSGYVAAHGWKVGDKLDLKYF